MKETKYFVSLTKTSVVLTKEYNVINN